MPALNLRRFLYGLALVVIIGLFYITFRPTPVMVDTGTITRGPLSIAIHEEGETRVRESYIVSAPVSGRLLRVTLDAGDEVTAGQTLLGRILPSDPTFLDIRTETELRANLQSAKASLTLANAELERAQAEVDFAASELNRSRELSKTGTLSTAALDRALMTYNTRIAAQHTAEAAVQVAKSNLTRANAALIEPGDEQAPHATLVELISPVSGRLLRLIEESEAVVIAGQDLMELGNPLDLEIVVDLLSTDAVQITEGAPVRIYGWGGDDLTGRVRRVEPFGFTKVSALGVEEQRVNVIIDFTGDRASWQTLGHGFRVDVAIEIWQHTDVIRVPVSALFRHDNAWAVFKVQDGKAARTPVHIGRIGNDLAEVISGLKLDDAVILHPGASVVDQGRIEDRATLE